MKKYYKLEIYLKTKDEDSFVLSFNEIEAIIGFRLPESAYNYSAYWNPSPTHTLPNMILEYGYKVSPNLSAKSIRFYKATQSNNKIKTVKKSITDAKVSDVPNPCVEQVKYWLNRWDELEDYVAQEEAIDKLFCGEFKSNDNLQNILIKCSVLNDFYSTNIFKIFPVAKHILSLNIDSRLNACDVTLVDDIAKVTIGDAEKNFYSFASKYCSHHKPLEYPIYDSYVEKVLLNFNKVYHFYNFNKNDLKNYSKFKNVLIRFREFFKLEEFNLKELDKYLWQFGKYYFPKKYR